MIQHDLVQRESGTTILHEVAPGRPPSRLRRWLIGEPLATAKVAEEKVGKLIGLAIFSSDALSSTAYATQEILFVLAIAGAAAFGYTFPISIAIVMLLVIVTLSYEQTIHAYPNGGGAYIVARDNLGELPAQIAAAALLTDYILTVAVSVSSGVAQITSAFQGLFPYRVWLSVGLVALIMLVNLRGVRESGSIFAVPTYFFLVTMFLTIGAAFYRYLSGSLGYVENPPAMEIHEGVAVITPFLLLRAFSSGTAALTGIEAISNGIPAFKEPRSRNAGVTLLWMSGILGSLFLCISFLSVHIGAVPAETETVISQLARTTFGAQSIMYIAVIVATTVILIMATNTAFNGFPRLSALVAQDGFLPRQLAYLGSRLVFSRGIILLCIAASLLIVVFQASVNALIPLYAIGVFLSFTLSQAGMAHRWWKIGHIPLGQEIRERGSTLCYEPGWRTRMVINGFGAVCTAIVMCVFAVTKFVYGAWIVLLLIPMLVVMFSSIHRHYCHVATRLSLERHGVPPPVSRHRVILPIGGVHRGTLTALRYARSLSQDVTAVYVALDAEEAEKVRAKWETWGEGVRLVILDSPYRQMLGPLLDYIERMDAARQPNEVITVVVPQFIPRSWLANLLHTQTAWMLRVALTLRPGLVIVDVPYHI
ncbi:MAG: APC family permease [Anaerolineae bacterium]